MTIIKPGIRYRGTCPLCACVFEVQIVETESESDPINPFTDRTKTVRYAKCPECTARTKVEEHRP